MRQLRCGEADAPRASPLAQTQVCRLQSPCSSSKALGSAFWITGCHLKAWTWTQTLPFWVTVAQGPAVVTELITKCQQGVKGPRSGREHAPPLVLSLLFWQRGDALAVHLCPSRERRRDQSYLRSLVASTGCRPHQPTPGVWRSSARGPGSALKHCSILGLNLRLLAKTRLFPICPVSYMLTNSCRLI